VNRPGLRRRPGGAASLVLAAALALTPLIGGCGTQAGAAAVVGDRRISVGELQTATAEVRSIVPDPAQITQQLVLGWLIAQPYVVRVAGEQGRGVSRDDARALFRNFTGPDGSTTPSEAAVTAVQSAYALQLLTDRESIPPETAKKSVDAILNDIKAADLQVNPRYGSFDYRWDEQSASFTLTPRSSNWLQPAKPSPAAPSPGAEPSPGASPSPSSS
jgi:hypothetical protein